VRVLTARPEIAGDDEDRTQPARAAPSCAPPSGWGGIVSSGES
jgi:hypothetical protein